MVKDLEREARLAGIRRRADLDAVERRRMQLWMLTAGLLVAVSIVAMITALWSETTDRGVIPRGLLEGSMAALSIGFGIYILEKERALRRLTRLLVEERVRREALDRQLQQLDSLVRAGRALSGSLELERVVDLVLEGALQLVGAQSGAVLRADAEGTLRMQAVRGAPDAEAGDLVERDRGAVEAARQARLLGGEEAQGHGMSVPLLTPERLVGVLRVYAPDDAEFSVADLETLAAFADHAASAVINAVRFEEERATSTRYRTLEAAREEFAWLTR